MSGGFNNPLVGGGGKLEYPQIQSPNFVHGVSGWRIGKDGTAEFQAVIIPSGSGGARIFVQSGAPSSPNTGDLWVQTSSGNEIAQWSGSAWVSFQWGTGSIQANAITAALIAANTITAAQIAASTITATQIASATITATQIAAGAITTAQLAALAVTAAKIAASTITASQIAANTITASQIAAATITATQIASHTITAAQIAAGTITATEIAAATITAAKLAAGIIVAGIVDGTTITGGTLIADGSSGEVLVYNAAPTTGDLIESVSAVAGTDGQGNHYYSGICAYTANGTVTPDLVVQLIDGTVNIGTPAQILNTTGTPGSLAQNGAGQLDLSSGQANNTDVAATISLVSKAQGGPTVLVGGAGGTLLEVSETGGNPPGPPTQLLSKTAGDRVLGIMVSGDTKQRLQINSNGDLQWGPGSTTPDAKITRVGQGGRLQVQNRNGTTFGNLSAAALASVTPATVTQATFHDLFSITILAADAAVGSVYRCHMFGYGSWGSTQQELDLACRFGANPGAGTDTVGTRSKIASAALSASAGFEWSATVIAICVTTGAGGTWRLSLSGCLDETANPINPGAVGTQSVPFSTGTGNTDVTQDTTADIVLGLSAQWASTTGAPTITRTSGWVEKVS